MPTRTSFTTHPLYKRWIAMKQRCLNQNSTEFHNYGARTISVCDRWMNSFEAFLEDMGECPDGFQLDRINPDGNYEPGNCRWATPSTNSRNRRDARRVTIEGMNYHVLDLAERSGLKPDTIIHRLKDCTTLEELLDPAPRYMTVFPRRPPRPTGKTHCKHGHEYNEANSYWTPDGTRQCRACRKQVRRKS